MDWQTAANMATTLTIVVAIPATVFALAQLLEMKRASRLTAFIAVVDFLGEERVREVRRILIGLAKKNLPWTPAERDAADLALRSYNSVAIMVRNRWIPASLVLQEWETSLILCWEAARPLVTQYRTERGTCYWQQLEGLCNLAAARRQQSQ